MGEAALLYLRQIQVHLRHLMLHLLIVEIDHFHIFPTANHGDVLVVQINDLIGVFDDGACIRTKKELFLADAHHQRTTLSGGYNLVGVVLVENGNGVSTNDGAQGDTHGCEQIHVFLRAYIFYQLHQHFGVGVALKFDAFLLQLLLQHSIVFNDAVVDDGQISRERNVWVRIGGVGLSVRGPSCVGNADRSSRVFVRCKVLQVGHLALGLIHSQVAIFCQQGNSGTVIASIFQSLESLNQNGVGITLA